MAINVKITGGKEIYQQLLALGKFTKGQQILRNAVNNAASKVRILAKNNAPKGPTGNIKRSVKSTRINPKSTTGMVVSSVYLDTKIAPHAHLVHNGTGTVRIGLKGDPRYLGKSFGIMPANPFLTSAYLELRFESIETIKQKTKEGIQKEIIRRGRLSGK